MFYISTMVQSVGYNYNPYYNYGFNNNQMETGYDWRESLTDNPLLSIGGLFLASQGINLLSKNASKALMRGKEFTSHENVFDVTRAMHKKNNLAVDIFFVGQDNIDKVSRASGIRFDDLREVANGKNAFYADEAKVAVAPKTKPSLILHELGHAINAKKPFLKLLQKSRNYALNVPTLLVAINYLLSLNKRTRDENFIEKNAGLIGFLAYAPTIAEEGLASIRGIKAAQSSLKGKGVNLGPLKKNYFFAWLTYLFAGIGLGIASKLSVKTGIPTTM